MILHLRLSNFSNTMNLDNILFPVFHRVNGFILGWPLSPCGNSCIITIKITTPTPYGQTKSNGFTAAQIAQVRALQTNQNQGSGVTKVTTQITPKLVET